MPEIAPVHNEWSRLFQAAAQVKALAPWEWMEETDIFGVQDPESGETGFVSIMGALGEHYSVAVYLGARGLYGFWGLEEQAPDLAPEEVLTIPQLQASFEDRNDLTKQDRDLIKELGLKFRGRQAWPVFRSFQPGFVPWYLEPQEVRFLAHVLEQVGDVAPRFKEQPELLTPGDDESYLVRVARAEGGDLVWEDQVISVAPPEPESISVAMDMEALAWLKQVPPSQASLEIDFFMFPAHIGERGERPYYGYMLLIVDSESGMILGNELLKPESTLEAMYGLIPMTVVQQLANLGMVPGEIYVRSDLMFQLLQLLTNELHFKVEQAAILPALDSVKAFLMQQFA